MPRRLFSCTPSKLASYDQCPRRYRMTYLDRPPPPKGPPWAHTSLGAAVHTALKQWWDLPLAKRTPEAGARLTALAWLDDGFRDSEQSAMWRRRAADWVQQYLATVDPQDEPIGVERYVATTTERLALAGRVDRIDVRDGEAVVVDYKTGRRELSEIDARSSQALACYVLAVRRTLRKPCTTVELHHLPTGKVVPWVHGDESLARQVRRAEATADDIAAATDTLESGADPDDVFPPRPGNYCAFCDFRRHCPEGQAAAPERTTWSALAEDTA